MADKKPKQKRALGRGLEALLDDTARLDAKKVLGRPTSTGSISEVSLDKIDVNPFQPRSDFEEEALKELSDSITVHGIIQPVTLRKTGDRYQLISGERRVQASRMAGLKTVPAYVRKANDQEMLEMALIENIQRENLNAIEIALSYQRLISECNLKQEELGERVGKNRSTVNNYIRLLKLPPDIQAGVRDNFVSMGHARALINIDNAELQLAVFHKIKKDDLSVRQVEKLVQNLDKVRKKSSKSGLKASPELQRLQKNLSSHFGSKVVVQSRSGSSGEIRIPYLSVDDLNRILDILDIR